MSTAQGPFPMETTYAFEDTPAGTRMTLRNRGEPSGFAKVGGAADGAGDAAGQPGRPAPHQAAPGALAGQAGLR